LALSFMARVPFAGPVAVGLNTTVNVQLVLLARVVPHVVDDTENGPVVL